MKKCPYCAEEIQDEAIKCKHCGEYLDKHEYNKYTASETKTKKSSPGCLIWFIIFIILCFLLVKGCLDFIVTIGKESSNPKERYEAERLEENIKNIGKAFWRGLKGE